MQRRTKPGTIRLLRVAIYLVASGLLPLLAAPLQRPYAVDSYDVSIQPDLKNQRLTGEVTIRFHSRIDTSISALEFDAGELQISSVTEGDARQFFERKGNTLGIVLTTPLHPDEHRTITLRYQATAATGLKFFPDQIYASVTSDWMPCDDRPGERAALHLTLAAPSEWKVAAAGRLTATRANDGQSVTEWQLDSPTAPSWFGFALGMFSESTSETAGTKLRVLGAGAAIFDPTVAAMRYLGERTGKGFPGQSYTQVFIHGDEVRSLAGLALLPESAAQTLGKPDTLWLLTSALAHQWYGLGIVSKDWSDLWLSDGVSAYLANSFLGERLGKASFEGAVEHSRQIYNRLRAEDKDRSLSYSQWTSFEDAGGEIPAHKGASFLFLVHDLLGDSAFWDALRLYTSEFWGRVATSEDFQKAFETVKPANAGAVKKGAAARKNKTKPLDNLFDLWVYGIPLGKTK